MAGQVMTAHCSHRYFDLMQDMVCGVRSWLAAMLASRKDGDGRETWTHGVSTQRELPAHEVTLVANNDTHQSEFPRIQGLNHSLLLLDSTVSFRTDRYMEHCTVPYPSRNTIYTSRVMDFIREQE